MLAAETTLYRVQPPAQDRAERLRASLFRLRSGQTLTATAMRGVLRPGEFNIYKKEKDEVFPPPTQLQRKVLKQYDVLLHRGDTSFNRAKRLPAVGLKSFKRNRLLSEACRDYCQAHEMLGELLDNSSLAYLFDRAWSDSDGQEEEPEGMVRRMHSTSEHAVALWQQAGALALSDFQRCILLRSLDALGNGRSKWPSPATPSRTLTVCEDFYQRVTA